AEPFPIEVTGEPVDAQLPGVPATITASDFEFVTSGLKAGLNQVRFENTGRELHHALAFPLAKGATIAQARTFFQSQEEPEGKPPVDFSGGTGTTVLDGGKAQVVEMDLEAGSYALVCFITNRAGGPPHVAMGMISELKIPRP
ncbi:MAG TPA: hypothetical protein VD931_10230, partial [Baekduia sp.]|nr:hypothetical protein [Baekduia sp.]